MTKIGPLYGADVLEAATITMLREYLPRYLARAAHLRERPAPPKPASYAVVSEYDRFPEDHLPAMIIGSPGITGEPDRDGEGYYRATWALEVAATVSGRTAAETRVLAQIYAAAVRGVMLQAPFPDPKADVKAWLDEAYADVPTSKRRSIIATSNVFAIEVADVVTDMGIPDDAEEDTYPTITDATVEVQKRP
jgi:hypothetical protein